MINYYLEAFRKYAVFSGRASRKEYWYFFFASLIVSILLSVVFDSNLISSAYGFGSMLPAIAVGVRRLHDIDKSGWWLLISLIPIAGAIWLIVYLARKGQSDTNQYGPVLKNQS